MRDMLIFHGVRTIRSDGAIPESSVITAAAHVGRKNEMSGDLFSTRSARCRRRRRSGPVLFTCNSILRLEFTRKRRGYDNQILANDSEEEENVHICLQLMIRSLSLYSLLSPSTLLSVPPLLSALPLARSETLDIGGI